MAKSPVSRVHLWRGVSLSYHATVNTNAEQELVEADTLEVLKQKLSAFKVVRWTHGTSVSATDLATLKD